MDELYELLQKIKERPGMYLGKKTLEGLSFFLSGYVSCLLVYDQSLLMRPGFFMGFQEYVQVKYSTVSSMANWQPPRGRSCTT